MITEHEWASIEVDGETIEVSVDAVRTDCHRTTYTRNEALAKAAEMGGELLTTAETDARWEQSAIKNPPHTQNLGAGENDAVKHSKAIDADVAAAGLYGIVGNPGKVWVKAEPSGDPLYGWFVYSEANSWRGIKLHPSSSGNTAAKVIQPYSPRSHAGGEHKDYSMTLIMKRKQSDDVPDTDRAPVLWQDPTFSLGVRCCAWLGDKFPDQLKEIPGPEHNQTILDFSKRCRRGGLYVGINQDGEDVWTGNGHAVRLTTDEQHWCATTASSCLAESLLPGDTPPHGPRVAVHEIVSDARAAGTLRLVGSGYVPNPGDLAILDRVKGESPLRNGRGHVRRIISVTGRSYFAAGGNESNRLQFATHSLDEPKLVAFVAYPQMDDVDG